MTVSSKLFEPVALGKVKLQNRIAMAPLTRFRCDDNHVPLPFVAEYYAQRASVPGTLLISEATFISPKASGYPNAPGIWSREQIAAWKTVTDAVHAKGSFIYCQLWNLGRVANPQYMEAHGLDIVSSSATPIKESDKAPRVGEKGNAPRELTEEEILSFVDEYVQAAKNCVEAGFDGVEGHFANGYLVDQFLQDNCNKRTDKWGGSVENRSRFALTIAKAMCDAIGADKVGARLSPFSDFQGMKMADPYPQFSHVLKGLKDLDLAYIHLVESRIAGNADIEATEKINPLVELWTQGGNSRPVLVAGGFKADSARTAVDEEFKGQNVIVVFGRYFISNPDLVFRLEKGIEFTQYDRDLFYNAKEEKGYTDYPFSKEFEEWAVKL